MKTKILLLALATVVAATAALAVPPFLSFQGVISNDDGSPVPDDLYEMSFRLYMDEVDDTPLWESGNRFVEVIDSAISIRLGEETPLDLPFDEVYWLGVAMGSEEEMQPRIPLSSAPYAMRANDADHLRGLSVEAFADTAHGHAAEDIVDGVLSIDRIPVGYMPDEVAAGNHHHGLDNMADVDTMGLAVGRVLAYDGGMWRPTEVTGGGGGDTDWTVSGNDQYSAVSGNVGIGTDAPGAKLDVQGTVGVGADGSGHSVNLWSDVSGGRLWWDGATGSLRVGLPFLGSWAPENMGTNSFAAGYGTFASNYYTAAFGAGAQATGNSSFAWGNAAQANGSTSLALGLDARAGGDESYAIGKYVRTNAAYSMVFGHGLDHLNPLVNSSEYSLMVGFGTTTPTLFVGQTERVGIGTDSPATKLDVNGVTSTDGFAMATGAGAGKVLTSDAGGTGTWQDVPSRVVCEFVSTAFTNSLGATPNSASDDSITIAVPADGVIVVRVVADVTFGHTQGTLDQLQLGVCDNPNSFYSLTAIHEIPAAMPTDDYRTTVVCEHVGYVYGGNTYTYYNNAVMNYGLDPFDGLIEYNMVATYYPD